jgi:hypothetical protein
MLGLLGYTLCRGDSGYLRRPYAVFRQPGDRCLALPIYLLFAIFTKTFAITEGLLPEDPRLTRFFQLVNLERGLLLAAAAFLVGIVLLLTAINTWRLAGFGHLDYPQTMRLVVPGATLTTLGFQTILSSFFVSILGMHRR